MHSAVVLSICLGAPRSSHSHSHGIELAILHFTPEHCNLFSGGVQLYFGVEKTTCFKWWQNVSFKDPC